MADLSRIKAHMTVIGADGVKVGTVDNVAGGRIKLVKADSRSHAGHHHYISGGLVATPSLAHEIEAGAIVIVHPWARATGSLQKNGAVG